MRRRRIDMVGTWHSVQARGIPGRQGGMFLWLRIFRLECVVEGGGRAECHDESTRNETRQREREGRQNKKKAGSRHSLSMQLININMCTSITIITVVLMG